MKWNAVDELVPPEEGKYLVFAESADEERPFIQFAWWNGSGWEWIVPCWAEVISHWAPVPPPPILKTSHSINLRN